MNYTLILEKIQSLFIKCEVNSFPVDCIQILESYGYSIHSYKEIADLNQSLYRICSKLTKDAFVNHKSKKIVFNNEMPEGRIRFSLAHELGHIALGHTRSTSTTESEANFFASNFLAPRIAIHFAKCKNQNDVSKIFNITHEAADYAFISYRKWHRYISSHGNKISAVDSMIYHHFYDDTEKKFVWGRTRCGCGNELINSHSGKCRFCEANVKEDDFRMELSYSLAYSRRMQPEFFQGFNAAEDRWLYGNDY